uniref:Uncharacterized protein n=1 Tax=Arundo donax TaxID=35708 RepID=A0A0A8YZZ5_ARUDO
MLCFNNFFSRIRRIAAYHCFIVESSLA